MSVSVIIPVYNGESTLAEAVESVRSQGADSLEIIVVDDGSTDRTGEVIRTLGRKVRSFRQANAGPAAARNRGLTKARGDWIAFLDADDLWAPGKLARQLDFLERHPEVDVVQGMSHPFRDEWRDGLRLRKWLARVWSPKPDSALFRADVFARVGPFAGDMTIGEDLDWFFRARELGVRIAVLPEVAVYYRRHEGNLTRDPQTVTQASLTALRTSLRRRRGPAGGGPLAPVRVLPGGEER